VERSLYNRLNRRNSCWYVSGVKILFRGNLEFWQRSSARTVLWHCN
jgi:hypothetical protein